MTARRLLRVLSRPIKRLIRPLRLRWIDHSIEHSCAEVQRLSNMRDDLIKLEQIEHFYQVQLSVRRQRIEKEAA